MTFKIRLYATDRTLSLLLFNGIGCDFRSVLLKHKLVVVVFGVEAVELEELAVVALLNHFSVFEDDVQPSNLTLFLRYDPKQIVSDEDC